MVALTEEQKDQTAENLEPVFLKDTEHQAEVSPASASAPDAADIPEMPKERPFVPHTDTPSFTTDPVYPPQMSAKPTEQSVPVDAPNATAEAGTSAPSALEAVLATSSDDIATKERSSVFFALAEGKSVAPQDEIPPPEAEEDALEPSPEPIIPSPISSSIIPPMPLGDSPDEGEGTSPVSKLVQQLQENKNSQDWQQQLAGYTATFKRWLAPRREDVLKYSIIVVAVLGVLIALFQFSTPMIMSYVAKRTLKEMGLPVSSFSTTFADSNSMILSGVKDSSGKTVAREVTIDYSLLSFIFSDSLNSISISGLKLDIGTVQNTLALPFALVGHKGISSYEIGNISVTGGELTLSGDINGTASLVINGSMGENLQLNSRLNFTTDKLNGALEIGVQGSSGRQNTVTLTSSNLKYTTAFGTGHIISNTSINVDTQGFSSATIDISYLVDTYKLSLTGNANYSGTSLDADLKLAAIISKEEAIQISSRSSFSSGYGNFADSYMYEGGGGGMSGNTFLSAGTSRGGMLGSDLDGMTSESTSDVKTTKIAAAVLDTLPLGDISFVISDSDITFSGGKLAGTLSLKIDSESIKKEEFKLADFSALAKGEISCADSSCTFNLKDKVDLTVKTLSAPIVSTSFEAMEAVNLTVEQGTKPFLTISPTKAELNAELLNPSLFGSMVGVRTSHIFLLEGERAFFEGKTDFSGDSSAELVISNFNFADPSYLVKKADVLLSAKSGTPLAVKLKGEHVKFKALNPLIAPSTIVLDIKPKDQLQQFHALLKQPQFGTSVKISGVYDFSREMGSAGFTIPPINFSKKLTPTNVFPFINNYVTDVSGLFAAEGKVNWIGSTISGPLSLTFKNISLKKGYASAKGINGVFKLSNFASLTTTKPQVIEIDELDLMLPFKDAKLEIMVSEGKNFTIPNLSARLAGGRVDIVEPMKLNTSLSTPPHLLLVKGADLSALPSIFKINAEMKGPFDARIPVQFTPKGINLVLADIKTKGKGFIKFKTPADLNSFNLEAAETLDDIRYTSISGVCDASSTGNLTLNLKVEGINPDINGDSPFIKNVKFKAKTSDILR